MKKLAMVLTVFWVTSAQALQVGTLVSNHSYDILRNGSFVESVVAADSAVEIDLPQGNHTFEFIDRGPAPTQTPTATPSTSATATPSPTPSLSPSPTQTQTGGGGGSPTPTATPNPTEPPVEEGLEILVASFDEDSKKNRFQTLNLAGKSLATYTEVLAGVATGGHFEVADLDHNGKKEVVAFGASPSGIKLEYWSGEGQLLQSRNTLSTWHNYENRLLACDFDGNPGDEVVVMGRNQSGIYRVEAYDSEGASLVTYPSVILGYNTVQDVTVDDVDGDGACEVVVFGRTTNDQTEATVIGLDGVASPIVMFGKGYSAAGSGFTVDLDGDGVSEIGSVARNGGSSFRLIVTDSFGQIRLKKNVLSSKFGDNVQAGAVDVDGDGSEEIVVSGRLSNTGENIVQVFDGDGYQLVAHSYLDSGFKGDNVNLFSDVDHDNLLEFIVAGRDSMTGMAAYQVYQSGHTEMLYGGFLFENGIENDPLILSKDLDMDGVEELLVTAKLETGVYAVEMREVDDGSLSFQTTFPTRVLQVSAGVFK